MPIVVGVVFRAAFHVGAESVAALLMVGTMSGILMATALNNGGGAWDNAKKFIETGEYGGKGSEAHKAAVVGDTVGDPFKDTAGPSLHVLIKLLSTIKLRSEEHTSELQSPYELVCRLLLEKKHRSSEWRGPSSTRSARRRTRACSGT